MPDSVNLKDICLIPNLLSLLRILLTPLLVFFLATEKSIPFFTAFILSIMVLTDFFDGYLSRKMNQVTNLGKLLDPIADKIALAGGFLGLVLFRDFPLWFLLALIIRDIVIMVGGAWLYRYKKLVVMANIWGKLTTTSLAILGFFYIFRLNNLLIEIGLYISLFFFLTSTILYINNFITKLKN